ncbi:MAG TPA: TIM barrel protein [Candidatus Hydrogenedentes bacterium]|nr:TIM barrel protein [Candidatus Hydrogenedentota bacterium]
MKIAAQMSASLSDEEIRFVRQLGIDHVVIWTGGTNATYDSFVRLRKKAETAGLRIWNIGNVDVHNMEEVTLNLPGRDEKIAQYIQYLRDIGRVGGIHYTTYAHMGNGIWSTKPETTRGGARARAFDLSKATQGRWNGKVFRMPLTHGRTYTEQEIWDNYAYFIKKVAPVAEEKGIRIGIHPDDPPALELGGVPRCIFSSFDGYRRALDIANSPNVGMCLCVGCWLEGGELMGKDIIETIRYFGERKKIFKVHFRNVSAPLPHFVETFLDNGYMNMYEVMRALREVDFDGVIITDHLPYMNKPATAFAHAAGYMRALIERANAEFGVSRHVRRSASTKAVTSKMSPAGVDGVPV